MEVIDVYDMYATEEQWDCAHIVHNARSSRWRDVWGASCVHTHTTPAR
jgi:hypothetical protein